VETCDFFLPSFQTIKLKVTTISTQVLFPTDTRGLKYIYMEVCYWALLFMPLVILHHLLNVSVQLANKRGFKEIIFEMPTNKMYARYLYLCHEMYHCMLHSFSLLWVMSGFNHVIYWLMLYSSYFNSCNLTNKYEMSLSVRLCRLIHFIVPWPLHILRLKNSVSVF
jgi:hypothetical protein